MEKYKKNHDSASSHTKSTTSRPRVSTRMLPKISQVAVKPKRDSTFGETEEKSIKKSKHMESSGQENSVDKTCAAQVSESGILVENPSISIMDLTWLGMQPTQIDLYSSLHLYNWSEVQRHASCAKKVSLREKLFQDEADFQSLLKVLIHPGDFPDVDEIGKKHYGARYSTFVSLQQAQQIRRKHWAMSCMKFPMVQRYEESRYGIARLVTVFSRMLVLPLKDSQTLLWSHLFRHRIHAWISADIFLMCLESANCDQEIERILFLGKKTIPHLEESLKHIMWFRVSNSSPIFVSIKDASTAAKRFSWRRVFIASLLVKHRLLPFSFIWSCLEKVAPRSWKEDAIKYYEARMKRAQEKKTRIALEGDKRGELEFVSSHPLSIPHSLIENQCLDYIAAALANDDLESADLALRLCSEFHPMDYSPPEQNRRIDVAALAALRRQPLHFPKQILLSIGYRLGLDPSLLCLLLKQSWYRENKSFLKTQASPAVILCPIIQSAASLLPEYERLPLETCEPEIVAERVKNEEVLAYVIRRVTPQNGESYARMLLPITSCYPYTIIEKLIEQAVGYNDPVLMASQVRLLQFFFKEVNSYVVQMCERRGLQALNRIKSATDLFVIVWRHHFEALTVDEFFCSMLRSIFPVVQICYWSSLQDHMLLLPTFSETTWSPMQLKALCCGPITRWFVSGGYSLFNQTKSCDLNLTLQLWFSNFYRIFAVLRKWGSEFYLRMKNLKNSIPEIYRDDDTSGSTSTERLSMIRKLQTMCHDILVYLQYTSDSKTVNKVMFDHHSLCDVLFLDEAYATALNFVQQEVTRSETESTALESSNKKFFDTLNLLIQQEQTMHKSRCSNVEIYFREIRKCYSDFCVSIHQLMQRVLRNPEDALYSAIFLKLYGSFSSEELVWYLRAFLHFIFAYTTAESTYVGIFLAELLEGITQNWITEVLIFSRVLAALRHPLQYVQHNALILLWELRECFPCFQFTVEGLSSELEPMAMVDGPLKPRALAILNNTRRRVEFLKNPGDELKNFIGRIVAKNRAAQVS